MSLTKRRLGFKFTLGKGDQGEQRTFAGAADADTVELKGLRASANISKAGGAAPSFATLRIYGMPLSVMNQLSTLGKPLVAVRNNAVEVTAGDEENGDSLCFKGNISEAFVDMNGAPEGCLNVSAFQGLVDAVKPIPPSQFPGAAGVVNMAKTLATLMGYDFENNGVSGTLSDQVLQGTAKAQLDRLARAAPFEYVLDDVHNVLAIWPRGGARRSTAVLINAETGMVGPPIYTQGGIIVRSLYNPSIVHMGQIKVESDLLPGEGLWNVFSLQHDLESETVDGAWFTEMMCSTFNTPVPLGR